MSDKFVSVSSRRQGHHGSHHQKINDHAKGHAYEGSIENVTGGGAGIASGSFKNPYLYLNEIGSETLSDGENENEVEDEEEEEDSMLHSGSSKPSQGKEEARLSKLRKIIHKDNVSLQNHPLSQEWTLWYLKPPTGTKSNLANYESLLKCIGTFSTVEDFWAIYLRLKRPSMLSAGTTDYSLFHSNIRPVWEDPNNSSGGKLIVRLKKTDHVSARYWELLICALIGGGEDLAQFEDEICGLVLSVRASEEILSLWTRHSNDMNKIQQLRDVIKKMLNLPQGAPLEYKPHHVPKEIKPEPQSTSVMA